MAASLELPSNNIWAGDNVSAKSIPDSNQATEQDKKDLEFALLCIEQGKKHLQDREKDWRSEQRRTFKTNKAGYGF